MVRDFFLSKVATDYHLWDLNPMFFCWVFVQLSGGHALISNHVDWHNIVAIFRLVLRFMVIIIIIISISISIIIIIIILICRWLSCPSCIAAVLSSRSMIVGSVRFCFFWNRQALQCVKKSCHYAIFFVTSCTTCVWPWIFCSSTKLGASFLDSRWFI